MPDYCHQCGAKLANNASYCPECGTPAEAVDATTDNATSTENGSWNWFSPRGPLQSPRRAVGSLNLLGFISFLLAIVLNAVGLPITALPHPLPIAMFAYWACVLMVGLPLWGLLHVSDNVLGFMKRG